MTLKRSLLIPLLLGFALGCSDDKTSVDQCPSQLPATAERAPEGDALCEGAVDCSMTSGQPDHQGCPNTCSCLCHDGLCYEGTCTAIACTDPPVYR